MFSVFSVIIYFSLYLFIHNSILIQLKSKFFFLQFAFKRILIFFDNRLNTSSFKMVVK